MTCSHIRKSVCSVQWRQDKVWTTHYAPVHQKKIEFKRESTETEVTLISTREKYCSQKTEEIVPRKRRSFKNT